MWMHLHSRGNSWPRVCHFGDAHNVPCWAMTHDTHVSTKSGRLWKRVVEALLGMQHQLTCRPWPKRIWDKNAVMIQVTDYISGVLGLSSSSLDSAKNILWIGASSNVGFWAIITNYPCLCGGSHVTGWISAPQISMISQNSGWMVRQTCHQSIPNCRQSKFVTLLRNLILKNS